LGGKLSAFPLFSYTFRLWSVFFYFFFQELLAARHKARKSATILPFLCWGMKQEG